MRTRSWSRSVSRHSVIDYIARFQSALAACAPGRILKAVLPAYGPLSFLSKGIIIIIIIIEIYIIW